MPFFSKDPRIFQIFSLGLLLLLQKFWSDFGISSEIIFLTLGSVCAAQVLCVFYLRFFENKSLPYDLKSPLITGLSLCLLLRVGNIWLYPLAAFVAISSKFFIRQNEKHIFNPANLSIVALLLLFPQAVWISPGQWGGATWTGFLLLCLAFLVLHKLEKADISLFFLTGWAVLIFGRALWLGDPMAIPLHQVQSGALLLFTFFMISDPKTTPDHRAGRLIFALAVALLGFTMQFGFHVREGLFYALPVVSAVTPLLDKLIPAPRYEWRET